MYDRDSLGPPRKSFFSDPLPPPPPPCYLFKVYNKNLRTMCEIYSKVIIKKQNLKLKNGKHFVCSIYKSHTTFFGKSLQCTEYFPFILCTNLTPYLEYKFIPIFFKHLFAKYFALSPIKTWWQMGCWAFTCSKSTIETLEKEEKYISNWKQRH